MIRYVITRYSELTVMAAVTDGIISDLTVADESSIYSPGDIVIAKIAEINRNRSAAFVELGDAKGYLPLAGNEMLRPGDEYPVMIKKEAQGSKDITVTGRLGIAGRYVVVELPASDHPAVHISHKIKDEEIRDALKGAAEPAAETSGYDVTVRTKAADAGFSDMIKEVEELAGVIDEILEKSASRTVFSRLYEAEDPFKSAIRDSRYTSDPAEVSIVTDIPGIYDKMRESFPDSDVSLYSDDQLPLHVLYKIGSEIESVKERRVWLKSGAYIVIDQTEAMCVIDVNSGRTDMKEAREDAFLKINTEAAKEIARQLRIRNTSGIIMIDFINMRKRESYAALRESMEEELRYDLNGPVFVDFTKLGVAELTRRKTSRPLRELLNVKKEDK